MMRRSLSPTLINPIPIPSMKKAIIILYVIVIVQGLGTIIGFAVSAQVLKISLYEAGKSIGENLIRICEERYVQK